MKKMLSIFLATVLLLAIIPIGVVNAEATPTITLGKAWGDYGHTVEVDINISNNPGILAMAFCVTYDNNAFEYVDYKEGYLSNYIIKNHSDKGFVSFVNVENEDVNQNGVMLTLVFRIKNNIDYGKYEIGLANNNPELYGDSLHNSFANAKEQYIVPVVKTGSIIVKKGDINKDSKLDNLDLSVLMQYINGWNVSIDELAAEVTNDNSIDNKDYVTILRYVNGWAVELQ